MNDDSICRTYPFMSCVLKGFFMPTIGFYGAGKVTTAMAAYLPKGYQVVFYSLHSSDKVLLPYGLEARNEKDLLRFVIDSDLIFIGKKDGDLLDVDHQLGEVYPLHNKCIGHFSGAYSSSRLAHCKAGGAHIFSLHPLMTFSGSESDMTHLAHATLTLEEAESHEVLETLLKRLPNKVHRLLPNQKTLYHASAVLFSNYLMTLLHEGSLYLQAVGIGESEGLKMMLPLIQASLDNAIHQGPIMGLTGPIVRGDIETIKDHLRAIEERLGPEALDFYKTLGLRTSQMIEGVRLDPQTTNQLYKTLKE